MNEKEVRSKVLTAVDELRDEIIQFAQQVTRIRSVCSEDQKNVTDFIAGKFRSLGFETSLIEDVKTKINVAGHMKGISGGKSLNH